MRILDAAGIPYDSLQYEVDESDLSGVHAASVLGLPPEQMFKTLVTYGEKKEYYVFVIPVAEELDLKKCARACGSKRVEMLPMKELFPLTGYLRGGCSPIGMRKHFATYIDETATLFDRIYVSGGQRGVQVFLSPLDLAKQANASFSDLIVY